jgi:hypothetical protein
LRVGLVNPGVAVRQGIVRLQLLGDAQVAVEDARFAFARGELAIAPTTLRLGAEEARFQLNLANVDAADLIATLNIPDLTATGRLEGAFPLVLSRRAALIEHGELRSLPGGGTIAYDGDAGRSATGAARVAFDALAGFRYQELRITLDGNLSDEVVSDIAFSGENSSRAVDLGPIVPGLGNVQVRGVPFDFNVRVTAPFRGLARTAASISEPGVILDRSGEPEPREGVDPEGQR